MVHIKDEKIDNNSQIIITDNNNIPRPPCYYYYYFLNLNRYIPEEGKINEENQNLV